MVTKVNIHWRWVIPVVAFAALAAISGNASADPVKRTVLDRNRSIDGELVDHIRGAYAMDKEIGPVATQVSRIICDSLPCSTGVPQVDDQKNRLKILLN